MIIMINIKLYNFFYIISKIVGEKSDVGLSKHFINYANLIRRYTSNLIKKNTQSKGKREQWLKNAFHRVQSRWLNIWSILK